MLIHDHVWSPSLSELIGRFTDPLSPCWRSSYCSVTVSPSSSCHLIFLFIVLKEKSHSASDPACRSFISVCVCVCYSMISDQSVSSSSPLLHYIMYSRSIVLPSLCFSEDDHKMYLNPSPSQKVSWRNSPGFRREEAAWTFSSH